MTASLLSSSEEIIQSNREYIEALWWVMNHSDEPNRSMLILVSYFDDSGSDDQSLITAIGGPVMSKDHFIDFDGEWSDMLHRYRIPAPLHMNDFVRPHGKHVGMYKEIKMALFSEVANLINKHKLYSVSVGIPQPEFRSAIPEDVRKQLIGPYALAFFCAIQMNQYVARKAHRHDMKMSYLVDDGSAGKAQLKLAHSVLLNHEKAKGLSSTGAMGFDLDDNVSALQAADVVAWSARRRQVDGNLLDEFEPLKEVLAENPDTSLGWCGSHAHVIIPEDGIEMWARPIRNWLYSTGTVPSFEDFLR